jgi:hypothetical protein
VSDQLFRFHEKQIFLMCLFLWLYTGAQDEEEEAIDVPL